jgi:hypothetical protein
MTAKEFAAGVRCRKRLLIAGSMFHPLRSKAKAVVLDRAVDLGYLATLDFTQAIAAF